MNVNDSIFAKMMNALQESKATEVKENLKALKESKAVKEDISQDSQIKTTNKGTDKEELDAIKPATGEDGVPQSVVNDKKLDEENPDKDPEIDANIDAAVNKDKLESKELKEDIEVTDEGNVKVTTGGKLIEISDECAECEDGVCPECGEEPCVCEPEEVEETEDLEIAEEPETEEVEEEEEDEFLDESTFNPFLTKFVRENYSNAKNAVITKVTINKSRLALECKLNFKSGKSAKFNLGLNGIVREGKVTSLRASDNGFFKAEAMRRPLTFRVSYKNNIIKCEGLEYNFKVKLAEGKMKEIKGKLIRG